MTNGIFRTCTTESNGYYKFDNLPLLFYELNETPQSGWLQVTLNRTVQINNSVQQLTNQNFTNIQWRCISGYKIDNCTKLGLQDWTINLTNSTPGFLLPQ